VISQYTKKHVSLYSLSLYRKWCVFYGIQKRVLCDKVDIGMVGLVEYTVYAID